MPQFADQLTKVKDRFVQPINLIGSVQVIGDLEKASKKAAHKFTRSIKEMTKKL